MVRCFGFILGYIMYKYISTYKEHTLKINFQNYIYTFYSITGLSLIKIIRIKNKSKTDIKKNDKQFYYKLLNYI